MKRINLNDAIHSLVSDAVQAALAPHLPALERIGAFIGGSNLGKRGRPAGLPAVKGRRPRGALKASRGDASRFEKGQRVEVRVGRGSDTGVITEVDLDTNSVMVKRDKNKQVVKRPARGVAAL